MSGASNSPFVYPAFGTDGVRGVAISEITPEYVMALGRAVARVSGASRLVIARDPRVSGPVLESAFSAGAAAQGVRVEQLGVLPTPAVAMISAHENVPGVVVTASHNKFSDNGIKVFAAGGRKMSDADEKRVMAELLFLLSHESDVPALDGEVGFVIRRSDGVSLYVEHLVGLFGEGSLAGLRIVIDTANGAMSNVAPLVLRRLGADVIVMNDAPNGTNINEACGATSPQALCDFISGTGTGISVDMGFAYDGDGDRLIAVDENGHIVDGDRLIALSVMDRRDHNTLINDTVVVTVMANLGFHQAMRDAGVRVVTTAVGDRYVLDAMESGNFVIGGEQSGHIIHRDLATTGDGLLASIVLAQLVRRRQEVGVKFSKLAGDVLHTFPQVLKNIQVAVRPADVAALLSAEIAREEANLGDHGRVLVRSSGTEPLIRVMVEADSLERANEIVDRLVAVALAKCV
ncbi:MAG: phosphoglucosamine mutase [Actinomycetes bacterium]